MLCTVMCKAAETRHASQTFKYPQIMRGHRGMLARQILARRSDRKTKAGYGPELRPVELALSPSKERQPRPEDAPRFA